MGQEKNGRTTVNKRSAHITDEEMDMVLSIIGPKSNFLALGVTQMVATKEPDHQSWNHIGFGVVGLVRDCRRRSYFVRFISFDDKEIDKEQEIYKGMLLRNNNKNFVSMEAIDGIWGFQFYDQKEREDLESQIIIKVPSGENNNKSRKNERKEGKKEIESSKKKKEKKKKGEKAKKKGERPRLEISGPTDFKLVSHIGTDGITGFENLENKEKWSGLVDFIYGGKTEITEAEKDHLISVVEKNGGIDKFANAVEKKKTRNQGNVPPTVPQKGSIPMPAASGSGVPQPPPPPSASPKMAAAPAVSGRASLLDQIHQGTSLKKVEASDLPMHEEEAEDEGILSALVNNLSVFRQKMQHSSSEDSETPSNGSDDW